MDILAKCGGKSGCSFKPYKKEENEQKIVYIKTKIEKITIVFSLN
jgi:hypothetical protein